MTMMRLETYLIPDDHDEAENISDSQFLLECERTDDFSHRHVDPTDDLVQPVLRTGRGRGEEEEKRRGRGKEEEEEKKRKRITAKKSKRRRGRRGKIEEKEEKKRRGKEEEKKR